MATQSYSTSPNSVTRRTALASLAALAGAPAVAALPAAAASSNEVSPKLAALIAVHEAAWAAEDDAVNEQDETWCLQNGVPHTDEAVRRWEDATLASDHALRSVMHFRCRTAADRRAKAEHLLEHVDMLAGMPGACRSFALVSLLRCMREEGRASA